jgi:hypothetical protein
MLSQKQLKSLEILKKFVAETPVNEVQALVAKYAQLEVASPTMPQYLHILNNCDFIGHAVHNQRYSVLKLGQPPEKKKIVFHYNDPAFCGVLFFNTFVS